jgi:hypothetical protein
VLQDLLVSCANRDRTAGELTVWFGMAHPSGNIDPAGMTNPSAFLSSVTLSIVIPDP